MTTPRRVALVVMAAALTLSSAACSGAGAKPEVLPTKAVKATATTTPTAATVTTTAPEPGSVAMAGFVPARVASAARFAEQFAKAAMSGCDAGSVAGLQHLMTPALYRIASKNPKSFTVLTLGPTMAMPAKCVISQSVSDGEISPGEVVAGMPSIRVAVTVTEGLNVNTTASPKTLTQITVIRRYTVDVLPSGTGWLANVVTTGDATYSTD